MIVLIQRVLEAAVLVDAEMVSCIDQGVLALVAIEPGDGVAQIERMRDRLLGYRVFEDHTGRMNRSLADIQGGLLLVSQFTLAADTRKGMRPSFSRAANPELAEQQFDALVAACRVRHSKVQTGRFRTPMRISLINDGPVTILLRA